MIVNLLQSLISFLDIVGVVLIGIVGGLLVNQGKEIDKNSRIWKIVELTGLGGYSFKFQIIVLGLVSLAFLTSKSIFSLVLIKKSIVFFNKNSYELSEKIINSTLQLPVNKINYFSVQKISYVALNGPMNIGNLISYYSGLITDFVLIFLLVVGLAYTNLFLTLILIFVFSIVVFTQYGLVRKKSEIYGLVRAQTTIVATQYFYDSINLLRELRVSGRIGNYIGKIKKKLYLSAINEARITFLPLFNKYIIEVFTVVLLFCIAAIQFSFSSPIKAATTLTIFLVATTRLVPALLRIQQNMISIKNSTGMTLETFDFLDNFTDLNSSLLPSVEFSTSRIGFRPLINFSQVEFSYPGNEVFKLKIPQLIIETGETVAVVGRSGSGKSTLVDLLLGMNFPTGGSVTISGADPKVAISTWPGAIAYVPQRYQIFNGTLRENLCLGLDSQKVPDELIFEALNKAQMSEFVKGLPLGLEEPLGDNGLNLSGGQRQRICIARALLTKPEILILDEATSSLDTQTEFEIMKILNNFRGSITLIIVAHRLSTVKNCEKIIFMQDGKVESVGSFEQLRKNNPSFEYQAQLAGY